MLNSRTEPILARECTQSVCGSHLAWGGLDAPRDRAVLRPRASDTASRIWCDRGARSTAGAAKRMARYVTRRCRLCGGVSGRFLRLRRRDAAQLQRRGSCILRRGSCFRRVHRRTCVDPQRFVPLACLAQPSACAREMWRGSASQKAVVSCLNQVRYIPAPCRIALGSGVLAGRPAFHDASVEMGGHRGVSRSRGATAFTENPTGDKHQTTKATDLQRSA